MSVCECVHARVRVFGAGRTCSFCCHVGPSGSCSHVWSVTDAFGHLAGYFVVPDGPGWGQSTSCSPGNGRSARSARPGAARPRTGRPPGARGGGSGAAAAREARVHLQNLLAGVHGRCLTSNGTDFKEEREMNACSPPSSCRAPAAPRRAGRVCLLSGLRRASTPALPLGPLSARTHAPSVSTSCAPHHHAVLYIKVLMLFYEFWILVYKP